MIGKLKQATSEIAGTSDIGMILSRDEFHRTDADDYIFNEDNEDIYFVIKSKKDEYCFTDRALIHVDGTSALSSKRLVKRYEYWEHRVKNKVLIETAGNLDRDVEIKFALGDNIFSIDVKKEQLELLKDLYKSLYAISRFQMLESLEHERKKHAIDQTLATVSVKIKRDLDADDFIKVFDHINNSVIDSRTITYKKDFSNIFEKYINN